ncbi:MAG TPA: GH92 family glycosyl hydrolase [Solirubrobacteraceae bacterium]|nr:GH92 family glycosyl hydrolase [Solirubrobacteraceae bacterium]
MAGKFSPCRGRCLRAITLSAAVAVMAGVGAAGSGAAAPSPLRPTIRSGRTTRLGVCAATASGRLRACPPAVPASKLPSGARNRARISAPVAASNLAKLVDTRTWTSGGGNTFPGADVPFGMVQWSPDTLPDRSDGGGYNYGDTTLDGYSLTHVSGPGCGAAGDVPILPITGALPSGDPNNATTPFTNTGEVAQAGYYSAQSNAPSTITSQFTATPHSSMGRFTFPSTTQAGFVIKLMDSQNGDFGDSAQIVGNDEVTGSETSGDFCGETNNGGQSQQYTLYFDLKFSRPFTASQVITNPGQSDPAAVLVNFDTTSDPVVKAKVGISYVSVANARLDWQTENPGWNFHRVKAAAQREWDSLLGKIRVSGGSYAQTQEFYSLLYKDFLQPNITSDVNGQFMGSDSKVHMLASGQANQYGIYSGWDIYHSLAQLQAILDPSAASDQAQSLVNYYAENGLLQQWGYLQLDNYVMVGDPAQSIISDYYAFGAKNFHTQDALTDMLKQATTVNDVRPGEGLEQQYGYLPEDGSYGCCNPHGYVSSLLEYDSADLALSKFAAALGDGKDAAMLEKRANNWENVFDPAGDLLTSRLENGQFEPGVTPTFTGTFPTDGEPYVEGDPYEYLWDVPNDYSTLFALLGGKSTVVPELKQYLSQPNGFGMYAELTNEFDEGEQNALDYAGDPAGTQQAVNNIRNTMYLPGPSGLDNNDDLGAESSQFIWEMLGLYPENSGSDNLLFTGPGFPHAAIDLPNGRTITIDAPGASPSEYYVDSLRLDGHPYSRLYVPYSSLAHGATLDWTMGTKPTSWGSAPQDTPPSYTAGARPYVGYLPVQTVTVAPGASTTVQIGVQNATDRPQTANVTLTAPSGLTVNPDRALVRMAADGRNMMSVTLQAASSAQQTYYSVPVTVGSQSLDLTVLVAQPGSLLTAFNNAGISNDSDPSAADFDSDGNSYSAQALAAQGLSAGQNVTVDGVTFTWPAPAPGYPDNAIAGGQEITVGAAAGTQKLGFLGSATNGPSQGVVTLHYTDGTVDRYWLGLSDWTLNAGTAKPSFGNTVVASTPYRNCAGCSGGRDTVATSVFYAAVPVDPSKTLASVTLPSGATQGALHIFAMGTSTQPMNPPVALSLSPSPAAAGQQVTIAGSGFGASQGSGYVTLTDDGTTWGGPGNANALTVDSWSDTAVTVTVPSPSGSGDSVHVDPGTDAAVTVVTGAGASSDTADLQITPTSDPADYYDNAGISPDNDQACANFDGVGYSYSATALAGQGLTPGASVSADGLTFTWPNVAACSLDNVLAAGQTMLVSGKSGAGTLGLLGASTNGGSQGTITINYTDGTSSTEPVTFNDWASGPGSGDTAVATMSYRNSIGGSSQTITMYVFATTVPVDSAKTVESVTLPDVSNSVGSGITAMHIFALSLG